MLTDKDRELITCCGLCCGDCLAHKGRIASLARDFCRKLSTGRTHLLPAKEMTFQACMNHTHAV